MVGLHCSHEVLRAGGADGAEAPGEAVGGPPLGSGARRGAPKELSWDLNKPYRLLEARFQRHFTLLAKWDLALFLIRALLGTCFSSTGRCDDHHHADDDVKTSPHVNVATVIPGLVRHLLCHCLDEGLPVYLREGAFFYLGRLRKISVVGRKEITRNLWDAHVLDDHSSICGGRSEIVGCSERASPRTKDDALDGAPTGAPLKQNLLLGDADPSLPVFLSLVDASRLRFALRNPRRRNEDGVPPHTAPLGGHADHDAPEKAPPNHATTLFSRRSAKGPATTTRTSGRSPTTSSEKVSPSTPPAPTTRIINRTTHSGSTLVSARDHPLVSARELGLRQTLLELATEDSSCCPRDPDAATIKKTAAVFRNRVWRSSEELRNLFLQAGQPASAEQLADTFFGLTTSAKTRGDGLASDGKGGAGGVLAEGGGAFSLETVPDFYRVADFGVRRTFLTGNESGGGAGTTGEASADEGGNYIGGSTRDEDSAVQTGAGVLLLQEQELQGGSGAAGSSGVDPQQKEDGQYPGTGGAPAAPSSEAGAPGKDLPNMKFFATEVDETAISHRFADKTEGFELMLPPGPDVVLVRKTVLDAVRQVARETAAAAVERDEAGTQGSSRAVNSFLRAAPPTTTVTDILVLDDEGRSSWEDHHRTFPGVAEAARGGGLYLPLPLTNETRDWVASREDQLQQTGPKILSDPDSLRKIAFLERQIWELLLGRPAERSETPLLNLSHSAILAGLAGLAVVWPDVGVEDCSWLRGGGFGFGGAGGELRPMLREIAAYSVGPRYGLVVSPGDSGRVSSLPGGADSTGPPLIRDEFDDPFLGRCDVFRPKSAEFVNKLRLVREVEHQAFPAGVRGISTAPVVSTGAQKTANQELQENNDNAKQEPGGGGAITIGFSYSTSSGAAKSIHLEENSQKTETEEKMRRTYAVTK